MKLTGYNYLNIIIFALGFGFSLSASDAQMKEILYNISDFIFATASIFISLIFILIFRSFVKTYQTYVISEVQTRKEKTIGIIRTVLIGYFMGAITLLGNSVIQVLFVRIFE